MERKLCVQCERKLRGSQKKYCGKECQNIYERKKGKRAAQLEKMIGNTHGTKNKGISHAPIFREQPLRPEIEGEIPAENLRALAATIILDAIKTIRKKANKDKCAPPWEKDLRWIHNQESNLWLWCAILGIPESTIRKKFK